MYVAGPVTENVRRLAAVGTMLPLASCTSAITNAASEPLAVTAKAEPSGLTSGGTMRRTTLVAAPAVTLRSVATTVPNASRHSASSVPDANVTFHDTWNGSSVVDCVRLLLESDVAGLGVLVPWSAPLMRMRTEGQLLNAFTVTAPARFQWWARRMTGLSENGVHAA